MDFLCTFQLPLCWPYCCITCFGVASLGCVADRNHVTSWNVAGATNDLGKNSLRSFVIGV